jgi:hypothetical protein
MSIAVGCFPMIGTYKALNTGVAVKFFSTHSVICVTVDLIFILSCRGLRGKVRKKNG